VTALVLSFVNEWKLGGKCLDVGSYNVNGCVKSLFSDYTGVDMRAGPNVDVVCDAKSLDFDNRTFDIVTCLEMLEHCDDPFRAVHEMWRVLKTGGRLILTAPGISFPRHDYPSDYWRFTEDGLKILMRGMKIECLKTDRDHVYGVGTKI
jgi:predicted SAM-dependent methyltransferase